MVDTINKNDVKEFFDFHAATWDEEMIKSDRLINIILDNAGVKEGSKLLDVACGTGVLIPYYQERKVAGVTAIDISPEMIKIASQKFKDAGIEFVCGDVENTSLKGDYDAIVVYNAFPHFPDPHNLISHLSSLLKTGGKLTIAHGMSRDKIDAHHSGSASKVSMGLMEVEKLSEIFSKHLKITCAISNDEMYQVVGENERNLSESNLSGMR